MTYSLGKYYTSRMLIEARAVSRGHEQPIAVPLLGNRIKNLRKSQGKSQAQGASEAGYSQGYLSQLENDEVYNLGYQVAVAIAQAFGVGINFFEGKPDTQVFLMPQARRLHQILSSPQLDNERRKTIKHAVGKLIPETDVSRVGYVELVSRKKTVGDIVYDARTGAMSQKELARRCNLSQGHLSQIEHGDVDNPSLHTLRKISQGLNIDLYRFLGIQRTVYPREIEKLDGFLRSDHFTAGQKVVILNRLIQIVAIIQPLVNRIDPVPQELQIK